MTKTAYPIFIGTCVELRAQDLHNYDESSREIGYRTFLKYVGFDITKEINAWAGWPGTHFSRDRHIRYSKGRWKGYPAICMMHSGIHHLWKL